jgi:Asp/Glu/hydantoin racemase
MRTAKLANAADNIAVYRGAEIGLEQAAVRREELKERIVSITRQAMEEHDVDVLFPQGVTMVPVHFSAAAIQEEVGIPVVDGLAASISMAELLIRTGVRNSRVAYPRAKGELL